jgi:hypothetical protein
MAVRRTLKSTAIARSLPGARTTRTPARETPRTMSINPFANPFKPTALAAWAVSGVAAYFFIFRTAPAKNEVAQPFTDAQREAWNKGQK